MLTRHDKKWTSLHVASSRRSSLVVVQGDANAVEQKGRADIFSDIAVFLQDCWGLWLVRLTATPKPRVLAWRRPPTSAISQSPAGTRASGSARGSAVEADLAADAFRAGPRREQRRYHLLHCPGQVYLLVEVRDHGDCLCRFAVFVVEADGMPEGHLSGGVNIIQHGSRCR